MAGKESAARYASEYEATTAAREMVAAESKSLMERIARILERRENQPDTNAEDNAEHDE